MSAGGACPDCPHPVSLHTDGGCTADRGCSCGHDYGEARRRALEEGTDRISFVDERRDPSKLSMKWSDTDGDS